MAQDRGVIKSIVEVAISNIATVIAGIIVGFLIPKVLTVNGYGFFKTFTLYITYTGMFSIGVIDGIVLDYGGQNYAEYDKPFFRSVFRWYLIIHIAWICILCVIGAVINDIDYSYIIIMIAVYMFFANVVGYFQQISQITQRFKEFSIARIVQSVMKIAGGAIMLAVYFITDKMVDYKLYIGLTTIGFLFVAIGYAIIYRDIIFGSSKTLLETRASIVHFAKIGFPLLVANLCGTLILTLDRQYVNILFSNSEYAVYAFAYNLLSIVTVATSAVSTVLYPILKRTTIDTLKRNYSIITSFLLIIVYGMLIVYFPLCAIINWYLPKYSYSLDIFRVIFPGLPISSAITVVMHNYYKTMGKNTIYFKKSILILFLSAIANTIAYLVFKSTISISIASIITMIIWYLYIEEYFVTDFQYSRTKNFMYIILMMLVFYIITALENWMVGSIIYLTVFCVVSFLTQRDAIKTMKDYVQK